MLTFTTADLICDFVIFMPEDPILYTSYVICVFQTEATACHSTEVCWLTKNFLIKSDIEGKEKKRIVK